MIHIHELEFKFYKAGIPYYDIDEEMIDILDLLNFKLKMKTKFCCAGHFLKNRLRRRGSKHRGFMTDCYICFDEGMKDKYMYKLIENLKTYHIITDYDITKDALVQYINIHDFEYIRCWCIRFPKFEPINNLDEHIDWYNKRKEIMFNNLYNILQDKFDDIVYDNEMDR